MSECRVLPKDHLCILSILEEIELLLVLFHSGHSDDCDAADRVHCLLPPGHPEHHHPVYAALAERQCDGTRRLRARHHHRGLLRQPEPRHQLLSVLCDGRQVQD